MSPIVTYFPKSLIDAADELDGREQLENGLAQLRWPGMLDSATRGLREASEAIWKPLPIVVSERPDARTMASQPAPVAMPEAPQEAPTTSSPGVEAAPSAAEQPVSPTEVPAGADPASWRGGGSPNPTVPSGPPAPAGSRRAHAQAMAKKHGVDWGIFDRQLNQESGYQDNAVSSAGARGPGQFMPATGNAVARQMGVTPEQFWASPELQIEGAALHMRDLLAANKGDYRMALAAYNAGQGNVDKYGEGVFGADFAKGQTRDYVNIILGPGAATRSAPTAGAQPAPAASPPRAPAGVSPTAPAGASQDSVWIRDTSSQNRQQVPRANLPAFLGPGSPWVVEEGPLAQTSALDEARASTGGGETMARQPLQQMAEGAGEGQALPDMASTNFDPDAGPREGGREGWDGYGASSGGAPNLTPTTNPAADTPMPPATSQPGGVGPLAAPPDTTIPLTSPSQAAAEEEAGYAAQQPLPVQIGQGPPSPGGQWQEVETRPRQVPVWDAQGQVVGYRQEDAPYGPPDPWSAPDPNQSGGLRPEDLPNAGQPGRGWTPAPTQPQGGIQVPDSMLNATVPRAAQQPALPPSVSPDRPERFTPAGTAAPRLQAPAEEAAAEVASTMPPTIEGPAQRAVSQIGQSRFLNEPAARQAVDIYDALTELPFDVYTRLRQELITDYEARGLSGTDPLQLIRPIAAQYGVTLPSAEEVNPRGRPASDVLVSLVLSGMLPDPADPVVATAFRGAGLAARGAGRALGAGARAVGEAGQRAARGLEANAERVAAADARAAQQGSTTAPGVFGISGLTPDTPGVQGMRPRVVPPEVADELDFPVRVPDDPRTIRAIEAAGGRVDPERGVDLYVTRAQSPSGAGQTATRGGVFYEAVPEGGVSSFTGGDDPTKVGGSQVIPRTPTRFRSPLILSDAPGGGGFDEGMRQLRGTDPANIAAQQRRVDALYQQMVDLDHQYDAAVKAGRSDEVAQAYERVAEQHDEAKAALDQMLNVPRASWIDDEVQQARRAGPEGSPARAQALKDLVSRYGGDPDLIDDLLAVRGADASESAWAIKENILAGNARKQGYDGVVTVQPHVLSPSEIMADPTLAPLREKTLAAAQAADDWRKNVERIEARLGNAATPQEEVRLGTLYAEAQENAAAAIQRHADLFEEYKAAIGGRAKISELVDVREGRNPTPSTEGEAWQTAQGKVSEISERLDEATRAVEEIEQAGAADVHRAGSPQWSSAVAEWTAAQRAWSAIRKEFDAAVEARESLRGRPPEYTLREDVKPPRMREREAAENARMDDIGDRAFNHPDVQAAGQRAQAAEAAYQAAKASGDRASIEAALGERNAALREHGRIQTRIHRQLLAQAGETASATAGTLPRAPGSGTLGAFNRAASEAIVGGTGGAVIEQGRNPDDPNAAARGFAEGMVGFPVATRLARGAARAAGRNADAGGGALGTLGVGPDANRSVRQGQIPGMGEELMPPLERPAQFVPPENRSLVTGMRIEDALPGIIRSLDKPPKVRGEGASGPAEMRATGSSALPQMETPPGVIQRIGEAVAPWANRVNILRYASMLSDTATQIPNIAGSVALAGVDVATTPIAAALDVGRVAAGRVIPGPIGRKLGTEREVFFSEVPARLRGMRAGSTIGLQAAQDVLRTGMREADTAKLDKATEGFGTNIPGIAPEGSRRAAVSDFAFEAPLRGLAAADAVFRTTAAGGHLMAEATAAATKANGGKTPTSEMIREAAKDPKLLERVKYLAARSVLQEDRTVTDWYKAAMRWRPKNQAGQAAVAPLQAGVAVEIPYVKTPYNVVAQGMGMTPAGLAGLLQDWAQKSPPREVEYRLARVALGTALMAPAASAYAAGSLTGPRPTDPAEASTLPPGWQPWSRKHQIAGQTFYTPLSMEGPLAVPAVLAILAGEAKKKGKNALSLDWAGQIALGLGRYAEQATFFEGIANISKVFDERTGEKNMGRNIEQIAAQFSPHVLGGGRLGAEIQRVTGQPVRDPEGAIEALLATHPATAGQVEPRQDVLGRPVRPADPGPLTAFVRASKERDAGVIRAFRQAKEGLPLAAPKQIPDPTVGGTKTLTPKQQHRWRRAFGAALDEGWTNRGMPPDGETLRKIEAEARTVANQTVLGQR